MLSPADVTVKRAQRGSELDILFNVIGTGGTLSILIAYFLLQYGMYTERSLGYLLLNLIGGFAIMLSLFFAWNLAGFVMECIWVAISIYGILKIRRKII